MAQRLDGPEYGRACRCVGTAETVFDVRNCLTCDALPHSGRQRCATPAACSTVAAGTAPGCVIPSNACSRPIKFDLLPPPLFALPHSFTQCNEVYRKVAGEEAAEYWLPCDYCCAWVHLQCELDNAPVRVVAKRQTLEWPPLTRRYSSHRTR